MNVKIARHPGRSMSANGGRAEIRDPVSLLKNWDFPRSRIASAFGGLVRDDVVGPMRFILVLIFSFGLLNHAQSIEYVGNKEAEKIHKKIAKLPEGRRSRTRAILYSDLGTLLYKEGKFNEAADAFEKALQNKTNRSMKRHIYRFLGKSYESAGRLDKCISAYEQSVHFDKRNWKRHRDLGRVYEKVQLYRKAIDAYTTAAKRNQKEGSIYYLLGRTWRKLGLYTKAEDNFLKARAFGYKSRYFHVELSRIYEGQSQFRKSLLAFQKGLTDKSSAGDWARFVYLAVLAQNKTFANQGMDELRKKNVREETLQFYESLVQVIGESFDSIYELAQTDSSIDRLFQTAKLKDN